MQDNLYKVYGGMSERERDHERFMIKDYKFIFDLKNEDQKEKKLKFCKNYHVVYIISR